MKKSIIFVALMSLIGLSGEAQSLSGAGATFPQPFYNAAFVNYEHATHTRVTYGGIGSGGGIRSLKDRIIDFGATDAFLSDKEMKEMPAAVVHIPTCSGAVVVAFNLPGIKEIKLTPSVLIAIFSGQIKNWDDPALKRLNPGIKFPNKRVTVVHRSDGSGTTNMFTDYLSRINYSWKKVIGSGKTVNWRVGIGAKGNPGVAGAIRQTVGAIGYVGSEYAFAQHIPSALIRNKAGVFVRATVASTSAAGKGYIPADTRVMLNNSAARDAYPIAGFTWLVVYKEQGYDNRTLAQATATLKLLDWMVGGTAQGIAARAKYAPLPPKVAAQARAILRTVTYKGKRILR